MSSALLSQPLYSYCGALPPKFTSTNEVPENLKWCSKHLLRHINLQNEKDWLRQNPQHMAHLIMKAVTHKKKFTRLHAMSFRFADANAPEGWRVAIVQFHKDDPENFYDPFNTWPSNQMDSEMHWLGRFIFDYLWIEGENDAECANLLSGIVMPDISKLDPDLRIDFAPIE